MTTQTNTSPEARRIQRFASFFKSYMSVSTVVAAALPIPVTYFKLIPTFDSQVGSLTTYTPLLCFLVLAYLFYLRHSIGAALFVHRHASRLRSRMIEMIPLLLIFLCLMSIYAYTEVFNQSVHQLKVEFAKEANTRFETPERGPIEDYNTMPDGKTVFSSKWIVRNVTSDKIPQGTLILFLYLAIFMCAEAAFVLMALREHLQDTLRMSDVGIMRGVMSPTEN